MKVAVYSITRDRLDLTQKSFDMLRRWAGVEIDHYVTDNGSEDDTPQWLQDELAAGRLAHVHIAGENLGQSIAVNKMLDLISEGVYDWVLRWDPDALPRSRRFLKRMVRVAEEFNSKGGMAILSPSITKLMHPPPAVASGDLTVGQDKGKTVEVVGILGGICRLHPVRFFDGWRFNKFAALGFGEAAEIADRCLANQIPLIRLPFLKVEHAYGEYGQDKKWPELATFERRKVTRYLSYGFDSIHSA